MRLFLFVMICFSSVPLQAQSSLRAELDSLVSAEVEKQGFSGVVFIARKGEVLLHRADGMAYYQSGVEMAPDTRFSIASVTKLFTAITILQLQEEGKLSLDDKLVTYFPDEAIPGANRISIEDLLLHNSGLPNERSTIYRAPRSPLEYVRATLKNRAKSKYGAYNYNNLDYVLLGLIVEQLRGMPWQEVVTKRILTLAKMANTGFLAYGDYPANFAYTYQVGRTQQLQQDPSFYIENFYAAANMYSTAKDLWLLDQALESTVLFSAASRALLSTAFPENNYGGYGVWNYRYPYVEEQPLVMERRGGILGANVVLVRLPEDDACIIILSNTDAFNPDSFGDPGNLREALLRALYTALPLTNR